MGETKPNIELFRDQVLYSIIAFERDRDKLYMISQNNNMSEKHKISVL